MEKINYRNLKPDKIYSFSEYMDAFEQKIKQQSLNSKDSINPDLNLLKLNLVRSKRILNQYSPSPSVIEKISNIKTKQIWLVITEDWCGDSAQNLPYIFKIASLNSLISLQIILRDSNLEIMDLFLTNGARSIPVLIIFNENLDMVYKWGPRPKIAQDFFLKMKSEDLTKESIIEKLHYWYAQDKGKTLENEFLEILEKI